MQDVVAMERLDADGELDEKHPGLVFWHHLALLGEAAQALERDAACQRARQANAEGGRGRGGERDLKHVAVAGVLRDDVQVHVVHKRLRDRESQRQRQKQRHRERGRGRGRGRPR